MKTHSSQKGFTIIETLVAITILMIAVVGPLTIAHKGLLAAVYAHEQVTASFLAQDALEYIKNVRDNNLLSGGEWLLDISDCLSSSTCKVDTYVGDPTISGKSSLGIESCNDVAQDDCRLHLVTTGSMRGYTHNTSYNETKYRRFFYLVPRAGDAAMDNEATLRVVVKWNTGGIDNELIYENELFNIIR